MNTAAWTNGKKTITGRWHYGYSTDSFVVVLDNRDRITGELRRKIIMGSDTPEWGNWKLVRDTGAPEGAGGTQS